MSSLAKVFGAIVRWVLPLLVYINCQSYTCMYRYNDTNCCWRNIHVHVHVIMTERQRGLVNQLMSIAVVPARGGWAYMYMYLGSAWVSLPPALTIKILSVFQLANTCTHWYIYSVNFLNCHVNETWQLRMVHVYNCMLDLSMTSYGTQAVGKRNKAALK